MLFRSVMLDPGANVPVISQSRVGEYRIPVVLRDRAEIIAGYDGAESKGAGSAYTFTCTLSLADHYTKQSFEVSPLQDDHDILMPQWWTLQHPIRYLYSGAQSAIVFDSPKCVNSTNLAMTEFSIDYDESVAYFDKEQKWVGVIGSLRIEEEENITLDMPREIPMHFRDYKSVYNGQFSDEIPPHRSFDHAIDMVEGKEPPSGPIYALLEKELQVLREYLDTMLERGKFSPSKSPAGAPILFVPKDHARGLHLCVDYRELNKVTILNRYPLPLMNELHNRVRGAKIVSRHCAITNDHST